MYRRGDAGERQHAALLMDQGYAGAAAARVLQRDPRFVLRWAERVQGEDPEVAFNDRPRVGRHRLLDPDTDRRIVAYAEDHVFYTAGEIKAALDLDCSLQTIRR